MQDSCGRQVYPLCSHSVSLILENLTYLPLLLDLLGVHLHTRPTTVGSRLVWDHGRAMVSKRNLVLMWPHFHATLSSKPVHPHFHAGHLVHGSALTVIRSIDSAARGDIRLNGAVSNDPYTDQHLRKSHLREV